MLNYMQNMPYYFYDLDLLNRTINEVELNIRNTSFRVHYAIKANNNKKVVSFIAKRNFGADCVSAGEIMLALECGFNASDVVFAGVGKTDEEIEYALLNNIGMIHCEGLEEIQVINEIAGRLNRRPKVALRLNPDVDARTHEKISTGMYENKFGFSPEEFAELTQIGNTLSNIEIVGLHFHVGSQITDMQVFRQLAERINELVPVYEKYFGTLQYLNVGGGLGIDYQNPDENQIADFRNYFAAFRQYLNVTVPVHFELGRSIVAQCGSLRTKVLYIKRSGAKTFAVCDAGMTELLRPAMYNAYHKIEKFNNSLALSNGSIYDVVGPLCESSDFFGKNVPLPELQRGDILSIRSCGAYAESMSLNYNGRTKIGSITSDHVLTQFRIIKVA
ncbi:MAG: diaminopimelate decarboxylase [Crocinitomicaceae bacterium]|nr:diaminopimelate decarboxylase [Crocinitomicaceae bacterium]